MAAICSKAGSRMLRPSRSPVPRQRRFHTDGTWMSSCTTVPAKVAQARISKPLFLIPPPGAVYPMMEEKAIRETTTITFHTMGAMAGVEK